MNKRKAVDDELLANEIIARKKTPYQYEEECNEIDETMKGLKTIPYGFVVHFKEGTLPKERQRVEEMILKEKCVKEIRGAVIIR
jgi:hypothetical protein